MYVKPDGNDQDTDVIVVGTGPGGLASVGAAVEAGAQVVAIEAHENIGGNGLLSTGWVSFVNTSMQRAQNIEDSVDIFMEDCRKLVKESSAIYGLIWDEKLTRIYAERSAEMYEILTKRGVVFDRLIKRPLQTSVDRLAAVQSTSMFPAAFESDFAGPHVKTYLKCSATVCWLRMELLSASAFSLKKTVLLSMSALVKALFLPAAVIKQIPFLEDTSSPTSQLWVFTLVFQHAEETDIYLVKQ